MPDFDHEIVRMKAVAEKLKEEWKIKQAEEVLDAQRRGFSYTTQPVWEPDLNKNLFDKDFGSDAKILTAEKAAGKIRLGMLYLSMDGNIYINQGGYKEEDCLVESIDQLKKFATKKLLREHR